jgi:hypothetical protein
MRREMLPWKSSGRMDVTVVVEARNGRILTGLESTDTDTAQRELAIENISALWRLIHLRSGSQQSQELSCQPPLSASI